MIGKWLNGTVILEILLYFVENYEITNARVSNAIVAVGTGSCLTYISGFRWTGLACACGNFRVI